MSFLELHTPFTPKKAKIMKKDTSYLTGQLLLATNASADPLFKKSVILVCNHDKNGAMGLILNKIEPNITLQDLLIQMETPVTEMVKNPIVHAGGPLATYNGFILHDDNSDDGETVRINSSLYLSSAPEMLEAIAQGGKEGNHKICLGYTEWDKNQLEKELQQNMWVTAEADNATIFHMPNDTMWYMVFEQNDINPMALYKYSGMA